MTARAAAALAALAVVVLVALGGTARAELDALAKAAAHNKQAQAFFKAHEFDRALAEYQAALDLSTEARLDVDATASLVFNIALCHDAANRPEQALAAFRRYVEMVPFGELADEAREDIARLAPIVDKIAADRAEQASRREQALRAQRTRPEPHASRAARYTVIAGAAIAAAGAASHVLAWRTRQRLEDAPDPDAYFGDRGTFQLERNIAIGAYAAGALAVATGLILGRTVLREDGPQVSAGVVPGGAVLAVGWSR